MGSKLKICSTRFTGLFLLVPHTLSDERGAFSRVFCMEELSPLMQEKRIEQINHSFNSKKGTVRGMHFQYAPDCEVKMVKCMRGSVLDIVIDIRKNSETFLESFSIELSAKNQNMLFIPEGFAHGFQTLEDDTELLYLHTKLYSPKNEGALNVTDPLLDINFPLDIISLSSRDKEHKFLDKNFKGIEV